MPVLPVADGKHPYPDATTDIAKLIRERGLEVSYEDSRENRALIAHRAADIWIPVLRAAQSVLLGISGGLFAALILDLVGMTKAQASILHVEFRVLSKDGTVREFRADGKGGDVLRTLGKFEEEFRDEQGLDILNRGRRLMAKAIRITTVEGPRLLAVSSGFGDQVDVVSACRLTRG